MFLENRQGFWSGRQSKNTLVCEPHVGENIQSNVKLVLMVSQRAAAAGSLPTHPLPTKCYCDDSHVNKVGSLPEGKLSSGAQLCSQAEFRKATVPLSYSSCFPTIKHCKITGEKGKNVEDNLLRLIRMKVKHLNRCSSSWVGTVAFGFIQLAKGCVSECAPPPGRSSAVYTVGSCFFCLFFLHSSDFNWCQSAIKLPTSASVCAWSPACVCLLSAKSYKNRKKKSRTAHRSRGINNLHGEGERMKNWRLHAYQ